MNYKGLIIDVAAFSIGAALGFLFGRKLARDKAEKEAAEDIRKIREMYFKEAEQKKEPEVKQPEEQMKDVIKEAGYTTFDIHDGSDSVTIHEIDRNVPYILDQPTDYGMYDDYMAIELTYYTEDDVLADDKDLIMFDRDSTVGDANLAIFRNNDENIMYIRNENLSVDYEIDKFVGSYSKEVLGEEEETGPGEE